MERTDIAGAHAAGMLAVHFVGANSNDAMSPRPTPWYGASPTFPPVLGSFMCPGC